MTQHGLAASSGISRPWIAEIESGRAEPRLSDALRLAEALARRVPGVTVEEIVLGDRASGRPVRVERDEAVKRRAFLRWSTAIAGAALTDAERVALALEPHLIEDLRLVNLDLGRRVRTASPRVLLPVLRAQMGYSRALLDGATGSRHRGLLSITGEAAALAGETAYLSDNRADALVYLRLAIDLAKDAADATLHAFSLTLLRRIYSTIRYGGGNPALAISAVQEAQRVARPEAPPVLRAWMHVSGAEDLAVVGDHLGARRALEAADRAFAQVDRGALDGYFIPWTADHLASWRGNCELLMGNAREAAAILADVFTRTPTDLVPVYVSDAVDLAASHARLGEVERSCELLHEALDVAWPAGLLPAVIAGVRQRWLPADVPVVRSLDERLRALTTDIL